MLSDSQEQLLDWNKLNKSVLFKTMPEGLIHEVRSHAIKVHGIVTISVLTLDDAHKQWIRSKVNLSEYEKCAPAEDKDAKRVVLVDYEEMLQIRERACDYPFSDPA